MNEPINKDRILVVDDDPGNIRMLANILSPEYEVFFATSGREALQLASTDNAPDLILLDIVMPEMDGYKVCRELKKRPSTEHIPIIFITIKTDHKDEDKGLSMGAVDYIRKPFDESIIKARVKTHLDLKHYREKLEMRVMQRTVELSRVNDKLQKEIEIREEIEEKARLQQEQLIQADKLAALGTLVSGVAHEINNPNNFILLNAPILKKIWKTIIPVLDAYYSETDEYVVGYEFPTLKKKFINSCENIIEGAERIRKIVDELKKYSLKDVKNHCEFVEVRAIVESALNLLNTLIKKTTNRFSLSLGKTPPVYCDFIRLEQVLVNVIQNACQAVSDKNTKIEIRTYFEEKEQCVILEVVDEGVGIPEKHMTKIYDPFFTTKRDSGGTGLGLSVSLRIINDLGGKLRITSEVGKGTTARIVLPIRELQPQDVESSQ